jgi:phosphoribosyl 1,2-cyclic phosphate phosphodiesterase
MDIYCEKRVEENLKTIFNYAFAENRYPGTPQMELIPIVGKPFLAKGVEIVPIRLYHHKLPVYGFRLGKFAYLTDFNRIEPEELIKLEGVETLIICALRKQSHISHLSLSEALSLIEQISPRMTYLTHMSHEMGFHSDLFKELPAGVEPAYDGLVIEMD